MQYPKCALVPLLLAAVAVVPAQTPTTPTYTNSSLRGTYVFTEAGLPGPAGSIATIGILTADGSGGVTGTLTQRVPGQPVASRAATGQYQINQDGSGSLAVTTAAASTDEDAITRRYQIAISKTGITGIATDQGLLGIATLDAKAAGAASTLASLKGRYAFSETGTVNTSAHVGVGTIELDGTGAATGTLELRTQGRSAVTQRVTGTYSVSATGLGELNLQYSVTSGPSDEAETTVTYLRFAFAVNNQSLSAIRLDTGVNAVSRLSVQ